LARTIDPDSQYRVREHHAGKYNYASTQPPYIDSVTGEKKYRHVHWGTLDENLKFIPGAAYIIASHEERARLIFPPHWDMSLVQKLSGFQDPVVPACDMECRNSLYGDIWLLEQIALKTGIRQDLEIVFEGNVEIVDDILTLAMYPYLSKNTYSHVAQWQRNVKAPSARELTPSYITKLTQSITEQNRMDLLKLRAVRLDKQELCAVDSTSRCAYGSRLADIKWGHNKENSKLRQTNEVVVYTLSSHMPVYYRTFPGNMPDCRTIDVILSDLGQAGFENVVLITDRGYDSVRNLEQFILRGQPMIMCTKTDQKEVAKAIEGLAAFGMNPSEMKLDQGTNLYFKQYDIDYEVTKSDNSNCRSDRLKLNLYFNPFHRLNEHLRQEAALENQRSVLEEMSKNQSALPDDSSIKKNFSYFKVTYDPASRVIKSFQQNQKKLEKSKRFSGFFSNMTHGVDFSAMEAYRNYKLRDEQEKYFQQMKDQMMSDRQRNWSENGKTGRLFILFVSLILSSYNRHIWKSTELKEKLPSSLDVLHEMRSIRCIEHALHPMALTPFVGLQVNICDAFGFDIPENCSPAYKINQQKPKGKRGRPPKNKV
jgi:transposase